MRAVQPIAVLVTLASLACGSGESAPPAEASLAAAGFIPDLDAAAQQLVAATRVKEGDLVLITGSPRDVELMENVAIEVQKLGGHSLISLASDRLTRRSYDDVDARFDGVEPRWTRILNENVDVVIAVDAVESMALLDGVPPERIQARARAGVAAADISVRRSVRTIEVGNSLYPSADRAAQFEMDENELARQFWTAVAADASQLAATGARIREALRTGGEIHVTHPNGTDLRFGLDTREVFVNDGALSDADVAAGGTNVWKYRPAGEVYVRVAPGSANGRVVADRVDYQGRPVTGLTIDLAAGRITSINAASGGESLLAAYNSASGDGRELLSILDVGINPALSAGPDSKTRTWVPAGMVNLTFGTDVWANGTNRAAFSLTTFLTGTTLTVGDRTLVQNGALAP
jgi:leucyl aminopeptidase (aminopeptidase T)